MTDGAGDRPDESEPRVVLASLLAGWLDFSSTTTFHQPSARRGKKISGTDLARISAVVGLVRHAYDTADAVTLLLDENRVNAAIPLVRSVYESALTAVWLVQSRDHHGITAFAHEYARGRRALQVDARQAASDVFRAGAASITNADPGLYESKLDSTQRFRQLCLDLKPGGIDAYILYRILSGYTHASMSLVDLYFDEGSADAPEIRESADTALPPRLLVYVTANALVWAGRAFSYLSRSPEHRRAMRNAAARLGITSELQMSEHYHARHARGRARYEATRF